MDKNKVSKYLSLVLRHKPDDLGITLDENGWTDVKFLLQKLKGKRMDISINELEDIVETNNKKRFAFNDTKTKIRANQGHSVEVDLKLDVIEPPDTLYHGTSVNTVRVIKNTGIKKMTRQHVHLSADLATAQNVGSRKGLVQILNIKTKEMFDDGFTFFKSENGVWLTDFVPAKYIDFTFKN